MLTKDKRKPKKRHAEDSKFSHFCDVNQIPTPPVYDEGEAIRVSQRFSRTKHPDASYENSTVHLKYVHGAIETILNRSEPYIAAEVEKMNEMARPIFVVLSDKLVNAQTNMIKRMYQSIENDSRYLNQQLLRSLCENDIEHRDKYPSDSFIAPCKTENIKLIQCFNEYCVSGNKHLVETTIQKNTADNNYIRLVEQTQRCDTVLHSILIRKKRKKYKLAYRVQIAQIKLLEIVHQQMIDQCKYFDQPSHNSLIKQVKYFSFIITRMRKNCQRMNGCVQRKKSKISEMKHSLDEVNQYLTETNVHFKSVDQNFEEFSKTSNEYLEAMQTSKQLGDEIKEVEEVNDRDKATLNDLKHQLDSAHGKTKRYYKFMTELMEKREIFEERKKLWKRRDTIQESLKEIIRMKTGIILREEDIENRIYRSFKNTESKKILLEKKLNNLKYQKRKLILKYQNFNHFSENITTNVTAFNLPQSKTSVLLTAK